MEVSEIADRYNQLAETEAPRLLPNGHRSGNYWMASGIADTGRSASLAVYLKGPAVGHWQDHGNAASRDEEKGDLLDLLRLTQHGGDMRAALAEAKSVLGIEDDFRPGQRTELSPEERERRAREAQERARAQEERLAAERAKKAGNAKRLYLHGVPIVGTGAEQYLLGRQIPALPGAKPWPGSLRFVEAITYKPLGIKTPAMLGAVFTAEGEQIGTHRTFLAQRDGAWRKIDHEPAKMMLGNKAGGFIPIHQGSSGKSMRDMPEGEPVYITEGIEDALCVRGLRPDKRIVAAIDLGNIGALILPERVRELVIVADRDQGEKAQAALERAIAAQQARGLRVQLVMPPATVGGQAIKDINDWVRAARGEAA
ncbi:DUF7146 domain-containing protein [Aurantiacibacter zhengii]|uniref:Uncharacterized protein n=1 Tax=Aurantiacibacter zhengii TaxID=2307003 RepID=A0A418NTV9_9SPHN|nr:toprim domain-containing protein [Aurantiacibacter zhengii]RIV87483.1 hypothetical protein D2V07_03795 [Aurantiacibacter zhengii]